MARSTSAVTALPDPTHPFARWAGVTVVGLWALGAQSFPDPLSKLVALLSPGIGYLVGHALDRFIERLEFRSKKKGQQRQLTTIASVIAQLHEEKSIALENGADESIVKLVDEAIADAIKTRVTIMAAGITK